VSTEDRSSTKLHRATRRRRAMARRPVPMGEDLGTEHRAREAMAVHRRKVTVNRRRATAVRRVDPRLTERRKGDTIRAGTHLPAA
jgi:hypothetical protein